MLTADQLEQQLKTLRKDIGNDTKKAIKTAVHASERKLDGRIADSQKETVKIVIEKVKEIVHESQEDTIEVLLSAIHTGYNLHDKRIKRLEDELDLSPLKQ